MKLTVIGLGKLGLPLAALLAHNGHNVIGIDKSEKRISSINSGDLEPEPGVQEILANVLDKSLNLTSNFSDGLNNSEISFLIVPTPSKEDGEFSNELVISAIEEVLMSQVSSDHIICVVSTVMPGTCLNLSNGVIADHNAKYGTKITIAYSPEFFALGTVMQNMKFPDMILIGESKPGGADRLVEALHSIVENDPEVQRMSLTSAELAKISVNTFVTAKISYANMIAEIADKNLDIDKFSVLKAVGSDTRIGRKYLNPGLGFGGPCFPRDNRAFSAIGSKVGVSMDLALATEKINRRQPIAAVDRISKFLNSSKAEAVTILGLSYKAGSFVIEDSQAIEVANLLADRGVSVKVHDPLAMDQARHVLDSRIKFVKDLSEINHEDYLVLAVNWPDYQNLILKHNKERLFLI